jgi:hypothetical protein
MERMYSLSDMVGSGLFTVTALPFSVNEIEFESCRCFVMERFSICLISCTLFVSVVGTKPISNEYDY